MGLLFSHSRVSTRSFSMALRTESAAAREIATGPGAGEASASRAMMRVVSRGTSQKMSDGAFYVGSASLEKGAARPGVTDEDNALDLSIDFRPHPADNAATPHPFRC